MPPPTVHISVGAGFENDRRGLGAVAAEALSALDGPRYLIFECLAERTLALKVQANDTDALVRHAVSFVEPCIETCAEHGIKIVSNFGGPNPKAVAAGIHAYLIERGLSLKVMAVTGDALPLAANDGSNALTKNAYTGAQGIVEALANGADIVVAGRVADPTLVVGPVIHELNLNWDDWGALANATLAGHLIECGTQVCGGYFADEGSTVPNLAEVGPPIASITRDTIRLTKPLGGGVLTRATVTQQMLYELHDPAAYLTPDVVLDITDVHLTKGGVNTITVAGAKGHPKPPTLKTLLCRNTGWFAEGEISYLGKTASTRANLARDILAQRLDLAGLSLSVMIGATDDGIPIARLRLALRANNRDLAENALNELDALYVNGPAGGGGVRKALTPLVETEAGVIPQEQVAYHVTEASA